jgi:hypothetical protein
VVALFFCCSWPPLRARAQETPSRRLSQAEAISEADKAAALAATREGNRLLDAGRAEEALAKFQRAHRLVGGEKLHYNLGQALRAIPGREVEAFIEFDTFLARVPSASADLVESAAAERGALAARLGFVAVETKPDEASINLDGRAVGKTPLVQPVVVQPGRYAIRIEKAGYAPVDDVVIVRAGQRVLRSFALTPEAPVAIEPAAPAAPRLVMEDLPDDDHAVVKRAAASQDQSRPGLLGRWWFWAALGVVAAGVAGVAGAIVLDSGGGTVKFTCPQGVDHCAALP